MHETDVLMRCQVFVEPKRSDNIVFVASVVVAAQY